MDAFNFLSVFCMLQALFTIRDYAMRSILSMAVPFTI